jgi:hypothetical protein
MAGNTTNSSYGIATRAVARVQGNGDLLQTGRTQMCPTFGAQFSLPLAGD